MPVFQPPTFRYQLPAPLNRWMHDRGKTVYRAGGEWFTVTEPSWSTLLAADVVAKADWPGGEKVDSVRDHYVFLGGRDYTVSQAVADELTEAGFTVT